MMPSQLWETTMDPTKRLLKQLTIDDAAEANLIFSKLLGEEVEYDIILEYVLDVYYEYLVVKCMIYICRLSIGKSSSWNTPLKSDQRA